MDATTLQSLSKFPKFLFLHVDSVLPFVTLSKDKETGYLGSVLSLAGGFDGGFHLVTRRVLSDLMDFRGMSRDICWPCRSLTSKAAVWV